MCDLVKRRGEVEVRHIDTEGDLVEDKIDLYDLEPV